jgi:predicted ATPase
VLRAASVFGESFWPDAVSVLVGADPAWVAGALAELVERDLLVGRGAAAGADAPYAFRHGLVRDAAYAMLTDNDRRLGHRLAADWLTQMPGADPMTIAEHRERAGAPARAVHW